MSFNIVTLCGAVVGAMFFLLPVKEFKDSYFSIAAVGISVLVTAYTLRGAVPLVGYINIFYNSEVSTYFKTLIKVLGITLLCNITSDIAAELGMKTLSGKVEFAGKIAVILSAMPMFDNLLAEVEKLI